MIGQRLPMVDARERVTGTIDYNENVVLPGMLHARVLRSPHAHARIRRLDASAALGAPGVVAVLTPDDLRDPAIDPWFGPFVRDQAPIAFDRARYAGEPVAAVAAETAEAAQEALAGIAVEYDPLPAVLDMDVALAPDAPLLHEGARRLGSGRIDIVTRQPQLAGTNVIHVYRLRKGDIEAGFAAADVVIERTWRTPAVAHVPFETHNVVAAWSPGRLTVWDSTQAPSSVAAQLAGIVRLPVADVRVIVPTLGGGFGAKIDPSIEPIAVLLARKARRPVRLALSRGEEFVTASKHPSVIRIRSGVRRDGTLVAHEATVHYDGGAYARDTPEKIFRGYASMGPYRVPNIHVDSLGVYTNHVPACAFRGFGIPQVAWAHESQMDEIANVLGLDPVELRRRNILRDGDESSTGQRLEEDPHFEELLEAITARIGWPRQRHGPNGAPERGSAADGRKAVDGQGAVRGDASPRPSTVRGRGIAAIIKGMSSFPASSVARLNADGSLNVLTSSVEMGQGALTALAQIAAHEATLPVAKVRISTPDTASTPFDQMTAASRTTNFMGRAIRAAIKEVKAQLLELAATQLEAASGDLEVVDGRIDVRGSPDRTLTFGEVVSTARVGSILGSGRHSATMRLDVETGLGYASPQWHPAVCGAEVEVDVETGVVRILQLHVGVYVGRMINPTNCELQVQGASLFGVGQALFEEMLWDDAGTLTNPSLADYMIPSALDIPATFDHLVLETPGTIDVHGIGETPLPAIAPAVANAVSDALGVRVTSLPITPEKVLRLLRERQLSPAPTAAGARPK